MTTKRKTAILELIYELDSIAAEITVVRNETGRINVERAATRADDHVERARHQLTVIRECLEKII